MADFNNDGWLDLYATAGFMSRDRTKPEAETGLGLAVVSQARAFALAAFPNPENSTRAGRVLGGQHLGNI